MGGDTEAENPIFKTESGVTKANPLWADTKEQGTAARDV